MRGVTDTEPKRFTLFFPNEVPGGKDHPVDETSIRLAMEEIRGGAIPAALIVNNLLEGPLSGKERTRTTITQRDKFPDKQGRDEQ